MSPFRTQNKRLSIWEVIKLFVRFPIGFKVKTLKGARKLKEFECRYGSFEGRVRGYSIWRNYLAVNIKKNDGKIVQCLAKNLVRVK